MTYHPGHVKHEPATMQVAVRTIHDDPSMEWSVATASAGSRHTSTAEVGEWADLHTPAVDG